jgi:hypothetical protein
MDDPLITFQASATVAKTSAKNSANTVFITSVEGECEALHG